MIRNRMAKYLLPVFLFLFFTVGGASAAPPVIYFAVAEPPVLGSEFTAKILIDADEPLNAYRFVLRYPSQTLAVTRIDNSRSIVDVSPAVPMDDNGRISFSGGSLAPFKGTGGELLSVRFKAERAGEAELGFDEAAAYAADGKGTEVIPQVQTILLRIAQAAPTGIESAPVPPAVDDAPPEIRSLAILSDPFNPEQKILSFLVADPGSGIQTTRARTRTWASWSDWQTMETASVTLSSAVWAVEFTVVDNSGNTTKRTVYDWPTFAKRIAIPAILAAIVIILAALVINKARKLRTAYNSSK